MKYDKDIREKARELFEGGLLLKEVAKQLDLKEGTVRAWKSREKWTQKCNAVTERNTVKKSVEKVINNDELTDKQELFCLLFSRSFNATKSYQEAFGCSYNTAMVNSCKLLKKAHIKKEVARLKEERYTIAFLSADDIFQKYMDIAFSDLGDYLEVKNGILKIKDSTEVDTSVLQEVKEGREGVSVKLQDKMKALEWLAAHMDMGTAEQRAKVEKIKTETEKIKLEISNLKGLDIEIEDMSDIEEEIYGES